MSVCCVVSVLGCATATRHSAVESIHASVGENAKTLRYLRTIDVVGMGSSDLIKRLVAGDETQKLQQPKAIALRGDTMIIADSGYYYKNAGMSILSKGESIASAWTRTRDMSRGIIYKYNLKTHRMSALWGTGDHITGEVSDIYLASDLSFYVTDLDGRRALHFSPNGS